MSNSEVVKVTLYIIRHGECVANVDQVILEPFADILTDNGKSQGEVLGKSLKEVGFTRAYASDYPRALETAQIVMRESMTASGLNVTADKRLRERGIEGITGKHFSEGVGLMIGAMKGGTSFLHFDAPNSETYKNFEDRILEFYSDLFRDLRSSTKSEETVCVVSHGLTNQRLMILLNTRPGDFGIKNWTPSPISERLMRNTAYHKITLEIPKNPLADITAHVDYPHCKDHLAEGEGVTAVKDPHKYTFVADRGAATFEEETKHYCSPV